MIKFPTNLIETVKKQLTESGELQKFLETPEKDLILYHHNLGTMLRNHYRLWNMEYYDKDKNIIHPDDVSYKFIIYSHKMLKKQDIIL